MRYFSPEELACTHCKKQNIDDAFMEVIDDMRGELGWPFKVTSAYRCAEHPNEIVKDKPGAHQRGRAIDIQCAGEEAFDLISLALQKGFLRIGVMQRGDWSGRFIHLDDCSERDGFTAPTIWSY